MHIVLAAATQVMNWTIAPNSPISCTSHLNSKCMSRHGELKILSQSQEAPLTLVGQDRMLPPAISGSAISNHGLCLLRDTGYAAAAKIHNKNTMASFLGTWMILPAC